MNYTVEYNMCRLCLCSGGTLRNIFEEIDTQHFMLEKTIEDLLQQKVKKESVYPWLVCYSCLEKLTEFRLFKLRCLECLLVFDIRVKKGKFLKPKEWENDQGKKGCKEKGGYGNVPEENGNQASAAFNPECTIRDNDMSSSLWKNSSSLGTIIDSDLTAKGKNETFITEDSGLDPNGASTFEDREIGVENIEHHIDDAEIDAAMTDSESFEITESKGEILNNEPNWNLENVNEPHKERSSKCPHCRRRFCTERDLSIHLKAKHGTERNKEAEVIGRVTYPFSESEVLGHRVVVKECRIILTDILKEGTFDRKITMESADEIMRNTSSDEFDLGAADVNGGGELELSNERTLSNEIENGNMLISNENQEPFSQKGNLSFITQNQHMAKVTSKSCSDIEGVPSEEGERGIHSEILEVGKDLEKISGVSHSERQECTLDGQNSKFHVMETGKGTHSEMNDEKAVAQRRSKRNDSRKHADPADREHIADGTKEDSVQVLYSCNECLLSFPSKCNLHRHILSHSGKNPYSWGVCCKPFNQKNNPKVRMLIHPGEKFHSCGVCSKSFAIKSTLKNHMLIHSANKPHSCGICSKSFKLKSTLMNHMLIHSGEKPHSCNICSKSFAHKGALKIHILIHSGEKPHSCGICSKSFTQIGSLKAHMLIHSGDTPHSCGICSRSFVSKANLKNHMLIHSGEKPHSCNFCHKSFSHKYSLKIHHLSHSGEKPHSCGICSKSFKQKGSLKAHMFIHSGERPHACGICSKSFAIKSNLKNHMLLHSGVKSHSCITCHKSFTYSCNLKRHMLLHSGKKAHSSGTCS